MKRVGLHSVRATDAELADAQKVGVESLSLAAVLRLRELSSLTPGCTATMA